MTIRIRIIALIALALVDPAWAQEEIEKRQQNQRQNQGEVPEIVVEPTVPTTTPTTTTPSTETAYPSLLDLQFGDGLGDDNSGVFRTGSGNLFDNPRADSIVTSEAIAAKQAPDMFHALQYEVGVLMQRTAAGQASPFVRGLTGQQVLLLIDGIRMNNSVYRFGPNQYFNLVDPGMVDHLEVLRGPASVQWGSDAIGGAINIVTRSPDPIFGDYFGKEFIQYANTSDISSYSRANVEGWVGQTGFFSGAGYSNFRDLDTGYNLFPRQPGTNYSQYSGDIKLNYLLSEDELLTVALQHFEQTDVPRSDRFPGYPGDLNNSNTLNDARFFDPQQRDLAYVRYQALYPNQWMDAFTFTASYHRQKDDQTRPFRMSGGVPAPRLQETDVETVGISAVSSKDLGSLGRLTAGFDWYHDDIDSKAINGSVIYPDDSFYERIGVFTNLDTPLTDRLVTSVGVRYENIDCGGTPVVGGTPVYISPSFQDWVFHTGFIYELTYDVHLVGSIAEGFRAPNMDELAGNNPNVLQGGMDLPSLGLQPEHALSYELGVKTNYDRFRSQTFVFWMDLDNNIVPVPAPAPGDFSRANQDSFIQGVETSGEYLLANGWSVYGNFWYIYGKNDVTNAPLSRIPPTQGILGLRWRNPDRLRYFDIFTWMVRNQDRLDPVRDVSDERIPPGGTAGYATLNVRMGRAFGSQDQHRVSLSVENITDQAYLVHGSGVYGTGVTGRFGYRFIY